MKIAITGGTGFVGSHLARKLAAEGHEVALVSRGERENAELAALPNVRLFSLGLASSYELAKAFDGCEAVAHLAGINRETGSQTFEAVHVIGTRNVIAAAKQAGVKRVLLLSFLRARPDCHSPYHQSKWEAEEIVRQSGLRFVVVKAGVIYGRGDHMISHISQALRISPFFGLLGLRKPTMKPLAVSDLVDVLTPALVTGELDGKTVAAMGPEALTLDEVVRRVGTAMAVRPIFIPLPLFVHHCLAIVCEALMAVPLVSKAQVRILSEDLSSGLPGTAPLPDTLQPQTAFSVEAIREALPERARARLTS